MKDPEIKKEPQIKKSTTSLSYSANHKIHQPARSLKMTEFKRNNFTSSQDQIKKASPKEQIQTDNPARRQSISKPQSKLSMQSILSTASRKHFLS